MNFEYITNLKHESANLTNGYAPTLCFPLLLLLIPAILLEFLSLFVLFLFFGFIWILFDIHILNFILKDECNFKSFYKPVVPFKKVFIIALLKRLIVFGYSLLLIVPGIYKMLTYSLIGYVATDFPELTSYKQIFKKSADLMKNEHLELFKMYLTFILTIILSIISFGLFFIWSIPYMKTAKAKFYLDIYSNKCGLRLSNSETDLTVSLNDSTVSVNQ